MLFLCGSDEKCPTFGTASVTHSLKFSSFRHLAVKRNSPTKLYLLDYHMVTLLILRVGTANAIERITNLKKENQ